jgi:hypothetical protein
MCHEELFTSGWTNDAEAARRSGSDLARRALRVGGDDPTILVNAAAALAYFGEEIGTMMALVDRALTVNPSFARGWPRGVVVDQIASLTVSSSPKF